MAPVPSEAPVADPAATSTDRAISFGLFRLLPGQRLLLENDKQVRLGSRALDILIALVERPGEVVGKDELIARAWPSTHVDESNLKFQVSALRRTLGDGNRYLTTIPGRGYSFVASVRLVEEASAAAPAQAVTTAHPNNLPAQLTRLVGRADVVERLTAQLPRQRLLTIVGLGGIGKTSVALAVAERLLPAYEHGIWLVDLAPLGDPRLVPSTVATVLDLEVRAENPLPGLIGSLSGKKALLVLDNCEHVIEAAAALATAILKGAPEVHILATSREPLRVEAERIVRLPPLANPPASTNLTAAEALAFPAVRLFVERATASLDAFQLSDADAPFVIDICRRLDGLPLALEFAAARVEALGVRNLAAHLDEGLRLLTTGRRTAVPRHRTLTATLDWSYQLLTEAEQIFLRRLAIFAGGFTLQAASAVIVDAPLTENGTAEPVAELVAKSLVAADVSGADPRFRLLDTTRAYALEKLVESREANSIGRRHAEYYRDLVEGGAGDTPAIDDCGACAAEINNIRAALAWAFGAEGDTSIGVALAVASVPLWFEKSLLTECRGWVENALRRADAVGRGPHREMVLQYALGYSLMFAQGMNDRARAALTRAGEIAERLADLDYHLRALAGLAAICHRLQDFFGAVALGRRAEEVVKASSDPIVLSTADWILGASLQLLGEYTEALTYAQRTYARTAAPAVRRAHIARLGRDSFISAGATMALIRWVQGRPDQSAQTAQDVLAAAEAGKHPVSLCLALTWCGCMIPLRLGDLATAQSSVARLKEHAQSHGLSAYYANGLCFEGQLATKQGDLAAAQQLFHTGLKRLQQTQSETLYTTFLSGMAEVLMMLGQFSESLAAADEAVQRTERSNAFWWMPEALRIKGEALLLSENADATAGEGHFLRALDLAHRQAALSWELRTATGLARLRRDQNRIGEARLLLSSVYGRFTEGFGTADLTAAKEMIDHLAEQTSPPV